MQQKKRLRLSRVLFYVSVIAAVSVGFWQRQNILDWWQLRDYRPSVTITALATNAQMTDKGRRIFYVSKPAVQEKTAFYVSCEEGETTIVLGCYKPGRGIYLLKVDDQRLAGVEEVTAAHEMLHAAYGRLDFIQQRRVTKLLNDTYASLNDKGIQDKIDLYKQSGADITNELHSILGTEVVDLPPELETYYQQYLVNRATVVKLAAQYQAEFTSRKNRVAELDKQLAEIEKQVTANNETLKAQKVAIDAEAARLTTLRQQNKIAEYNAGVDAYNQSLQPFRVLQGQTQTLVDQYKAILDERNAVAAEAQELNKALDSRIQTTTDTVQ